MADETKKPDAAMNLDRYGYGQCARCETRRPAAALVLVDVTTAGATGQPPLLAPTCRDAALCLRMRIPFGAP